MSFVRQRYFHFGCWLKNFHSDLQTNCPSSSRRRWLHCHRAPWGSWRWSSRSCASSPTSWRLTTRWRTTGSSRRWCWTGSAWSPSPASRCSPQLPSSSPPPMSLSPSEERKNLNTFFHLSIWLWPLCVGRRPKVMVLDLSWLLCRYRYLGGWLANHFTLMGKSCHIPEWCL